MLLRGVRVRSYDRGIYDVVKVTVVLFADIVGISEGNSFKALKRTISETETGLLCWVSKITFSHMTLIRIWIVGRRDIANERFMLDFFVTEQEIVNGYLCIRLKLSAVFGLTIVDSTCLVLSITERVVWKVIVKIFLSIKVTRDLVKLLRTIGVDNSVQVFLFLHEEEDRNNSSYDVPFWNVEGVLTVFHELLLHIHNWRETMIRDKDYLRDVLDVVKHVAGIFFVVLLEVI